MCESTAQYDSRIEGEPSQRRCTTMRMVGSTASATQASRSTATTQRRVHTVSRSSERKLEASPSIFRVTESATEPGSPRPSTRKTSLPEGGTEPRASCTGEEAPGEDSETPQSGRKTSSSSETRGSPSGRPAVEPQAWPSSTASSQRRDHAVSNSITPERINNTNQWGDFRPFEANKSSILVETGGDQTQNIIPRCPVKRHRTNQQHHSGAHEAPRPPTLRVHPTDVVPTPRIVRLTSVIVPCSQNLPQLGRAKPNKLTISFPNGRHLDKRINSISRAIPSSHSNEQIRYRPLNYINSFWGLPRRQVARPKMNRVTKSHA